MYKLYTFARSSTAWRARIALNLKGIKPQYIYVHLFKGQQRSESYKKLNPQMGVPTLILPNGTPLIQTMAIAEYLNEIHPQPHNFFPGSPIERAHIRGFCEVINSGIHPYQNLRLIEKLQTQFKADKGKWLREWLTRGTETIQTMIAKHNKGSDYIFGDKITCADIFFYPQIMNTKYRFKLDISGFPNVSRILQNLQKVKEFQDSEPQKQKDFE